jgi:hypothetical protein
MVAVGIHGHGRLPRHFHGDQVWSQNGYKEKVFLKSSVCDAARVGRQVQPFTVVGNTDDKRDVLGQEDWDG